MLRTLVVLLLLANAGFFAWHQGWLDGVVGVSTQQGREPERLTQQINPERLIVLAPQAASPALAVQASSSAPAPTDATSGAASAPPSVASGAASAADAGSMPAAQGACQEAGPFTPDEYKQVSALLGQRLPTGSWSGETVAVQGLWLVYMGPYPDEDTYLRKQAELRRIKGMNFEEVRSPAKLAMGLALGRYQSEAQATAAIEAMKLKGVRTAYVVNIRPTMDFTVVRVMQASAAVQKLLPGLSLPPGKGFVPCPP
jgi:hypothetical protein